jgi:hypothetical protein
MFLYFEDYSQFIPTLNLKNLPHGNKIIKVYPSDLDPRLVLGKPDIAVIKSEDQPLSDETFIYPDREIYKGYQIESKIIELNLNQLGMRAVRSLFRFSNRADLGFCQTAMNIKRDGMWLIDHPLDDIDGIPQAVMNPEKRSLAIHLDIFMPESLRRLDRLIGWQNSEHLVTNREGFRLKCLEPQLYPHGRKEIG